MGNGRSSTMSAVQSCGKRKNVNHVWRTVLRETEELQPCLEYRLEGNGRTSTISGVQPYGKRKNFNHVWGTALWETEELQPRLATIVLPCGKRDNVNYVWSTQRTLLYYIVQWYNNAETEELAQYAFSEIDITIVCARAEGHSSTNRACQQLVAWVPTRRFVISWIVAEPETNRIVQRYTILAFVNWLYLSSRPTAIDLMSSKKRLSRVDKTDDKKLSQYAWPHCRNDEIMNRITVRLVICPFWPDMKRDSLASDSSLSNIRM